MLVGDLQNHGDSAAKLNRFASNTVKLVRKCFDKMAWRCHILVGASGYDFYCLQNRSSALHAGTKRNTLADGEIAVADERRTSFIVLIP